MPVLIALSHDILITSGVYALVGREVTTSTVAALLTILGYSLYDTIIVFDRIRENVPRMPRATFSQIVNRSMSEVLIRSLVTSLCTLLPVSALMLFGGETLRDFAFALLVGIASGAYSSIFIASPVLTLWKEREPVYVRRRKVIMAENDGHVPPFAATTLGEDADEDAAAGARRPRQPSAEAAALRRPDAGARRGPRAARRPRRHRPRPLPSPPRPSLRPPSLPLPPSRRRRRGAPAGAEPRDRGTRRGGSVRRRRRRQARGRRSRRSPTSSTAGGTPPRPKAKPKPKRQRARKKHGRR